MGGCGDPLPFQIRRLVSSMIAMAGARVPWKQGKALVEELDGGIRISLGGKGKRGCQRCSGNGVGTAKRRADPGPTKTCLVTLLQDAVYLV